MSSWEGVDRKCTVFLHILSCLAQEKLQLVLRAVPHNEIQVFSDVIVTAVLQDNPAVLT